MECFIKKVFEGKVNEAVHRQFIRFGKGKFESRAIIKLWKTDKIKINGSFEWANDFVEIVSGLQDLKFSGLVLSKEKLNILGEEKIKSGIYEYIVDSLESREIEKIKDSTYFILLDADGQGISLKIKKKLPKPGKSKEGKIDYKFCQIEADLKYWPAIKEALFWDLPDCKKASISHEYLIEEIIPLQEGKDFEKIRVMARRKGRIMRKIEFDGKGQSSLTPIIHEKEMEV